MEEKLTVEQLRGFAAELRGGLTLNAFNRLDAHKAMPFGGVRLGRIKKLWEGKPHPMVVAEKYDGALPPTLKVCPSTSDRKSPRPHVLCLPPGGIALKKRFPSGECKYVTSYVLCDMQFPIPTADLWSWKFINVLAPSHIEQLDMCLEAAKGIVRG